MTAVRRRLVVVAVAVGVLALAFALRPAGDQAVPAGAAPAFEGEDLAGERLELADFRGDPVLVNFWASWCLPCRREFPLLQAVHGDAVQVVGVVFEDTRRRAAAFARDQGATWRSVLDPDGRIADDYGVGFRPGLPVTVAVDRRGVLVERHVGELRREDLDRLVAAANR